jgi:predicted unusual protein kinase regulating ubiquinone biosynthesis (AarF/ABC1/UbiB family)
LASATALGASYDLEGLADQVLQAIGRELDFRVEAGNTLKLQGILGRSKFVPNGSLKVPNVVPALSSQRVLVLEWIDGHNILGEEAKAALTQHGSNIDAATKALLGAFVEQYFMEGFFHADPHPGNLKVDGDGVITLLDEGMVGMFDPRSRTTLLDLVLALINQDGARATDLLVQLAPPPAGVKVDRRQLQSQSPTLKAWGDRSTPTSASPPKCSRWWGSCSAIPCCCPRSG